MTSTTSMPKAGFASPIRSLGDIPRVHGSASPDKPAIVFEGRTTSWRTLDEETARIAAALVAEGLPAGARVGYIGKNSDLLVALVLGAARAGIVTVPINWRLASSEVCDIIDDAELDLLFVGEPMFFDTAERALELCLRLGKWIAMEGETEGVESFSGWYGCHLAKGGDRLVDPNAVALQFYTSGTTGRAKGVMLSHHNFLSFRDLRENGPAYDRWGPDDVSLNVLPMAHVGGINLCLKPLHAGAKLVVMREMTPKAVLDCIAEHRVTTFCLVPSAIHMLLAEPATADVDFSSVRLLSYGSAAMPLELLKRGLEIVGCDFAQGYGMTETFGLVTMLGPEDHDVAGSERMRSAGRPLPGVRISIVDAEHRELGVRAIGEVAIHSPSNMIGYWKQPEATARAINSDGWLYTGDGGYLDEDGYLYICDRLKDMVISGGENVYPAEVENAIFGHPAVDQIAVIGLPDEKWGEVVTAIVVPREGQPADAADIIRWTRARIAAFKTPKSVIFVETLPRNASGKVLKHELRALLAGSGH